MVCINDFLNCPEKKSSLSQDFLKKVHQVAKYMRRCQISKKKIQKVADGNITGNDLYSIVCCEGEKSEFLRKTVTFLKVKPCNLLFADAKQVAKRYAHSLKLLQ